MSRLALPLVALLAVVAVALPTRAAGTQQAEVRIMTMSPLVVRGTGFKAHERVRVTAAPGGVRRVVARSNGSFRAAFAKSIDRCVGLSVVATGILRARPALK